MLKSKRYLALILALLTALSAGGIILFSSQPATASAKQSSEVTRIILRVVLPRFHTLNAADQKVLIKKYDPYVRKAAHVTEFCLFGFFLCLLLATQGIRRQHLFSLLGGLALAVIDECRQIFSQGRGPRVTDVLIDCVGVAIGILFAALILHFVNKKKQLPADDAPVNAPLE